MRDVDDGTQNTDELSASLRGGKIQKKKKKKAQKALRINSKPRSIYVTVTPLRHITRTNNKEKPQGPIPDTLRWAKLVETTGISLESKLDLKLRGVSP